MVWFHLPPSLWPLAPGIYAAFRSQNVWFENLVKLFLFLRLLRDGEPWLCPQVVVALYCYLFLQNKIK